MKKTKVMVFMSLICSVALFFSSCKKEKDAETEGDVNFSFDVSSLKSGETEPKKILISIETSVGEAVYTDREVKLYTIGTDYASEAIKMKTGAFKLTKFIVLNESDEALYATPVEGSDLAKYVQDPLAIDFSVNNAATTKVVPQVVATVNHAAKEFGYSGFGFTVVNVQRIKLAPIAFNEKKGKFERVPFHLTLKDEAGAVIASTKPASGLKATGYPVDFVGITHGDAARLKMDIDGDGTATEYDVTNNGADPITGETYYTICDPVTGTCQEMDEYTFNQYQDIYITISNTSGNTSETLDPATPIDVVIETPNGTTTSNTTFGELKSTADDAEEAGEEPTFDFVEPTYYAMINSINLCYPSIWQEDPGDVGMYGLTSDYEWNTTECSVTKITHLGGSTITTTALGVNMQDPSNYLGGHTRLQFSFDTYSGSAGSGYNSVFITVTGVSSGYSTSKYWGPDMNDYTFDETGYAHINTTFDLPLEDLEATITIALGKGGDKLWNLEVSSLQMGEFGK